MDAIRNYLESLFGSMPQEERVLKAKEDLLTMMEDKYNELLCSGSRENEAIGIVISEFGNIDELKEELGILPESENQLTVTAAVARNYISTTQKKSHSIAFAIFLFIAGTVFPILMEEARILEMFGVSESLAGIIGIGGFMIAIAAGVGILIASAFSLEKYEEIEKKPFRLEAGLKHDIQNEYFKKKKELMPRLIAGVSLLILSFLPAAVFELAFKDSALMNIGGAILLLMVGVGVYLLVGYGVTLSSYEKLIETRDEAAVAKERRNGLVAGIYWILLLAIYLGYSFITNNWQYSWIIWPVGALVYAVIHMILNRTN